MVTDESVNEEKENDEKVTRETANYVKVTDETVNYEKVNKQSTYLARALAWRPGTFSGSARRSHANAPD